MFESLVGLNVIDEEGYKKYRASMTPILQTYGGYFRYDFVVATVLKTESTHPINRVFVIAFPDEDRKTRFFADPAYQKVRHTLFDPSVQGVTAIGDFTRPA